MFDLTDSHPPAHTISTDFTNRRNNKDQNYNNKRNAKRNRQAVGKEVKEQMKRPHKRVVSCSHTNGKTASENNCRPRYRNDQNGHRS